MGFFVLFQSMFHLIDAFLIGLNVIFDLYMSYKEIVNFKISPLTIYIQGGGNLLAVVKYSVSEMFVVSILSETLTCRTFPYCFVKLFENLIEDRTSQKNDLKKINNVAFSAFMIILCDMAVCRSCLESLLLTCIV